MKRCVRTGLVAFLAAALLAVLALSACGEEKPTGTVKELEFAGTAGKAKVYLYSPTKPDFPGTVMPTTFVYPEKTVANSKEALDYLVKTGIKDILEENGLFGMVFSPIDPAGYTEADIEIMNAAKSQFSDYGYLLNGTREAGGTVVNVSGTQYAGSRFRNYIYAAGASADFIAKYATKSMPYTLQYADGGSITFNHLPAAVALFDVKEPAQPGDKPNPIPAYIVNGTQEVVDSFRALNGEDYPTVAKKAKGGIKPELAREAWELMVPWQRTECTPGIFLMTKYIVDYDEAGLTYTPHVKEVIPEIGNGYPYTYFTWVPKTVAKSDSKVPMVMLFHGGNNSALYIAQTSDWLRVALENNLVVVSVQHSGVLDDNGGEIPAATPADIKALLDYLLKDEDLKIDPTRVFVSGFSMGSLMTTNLAKEYPTSFAGFGPCNPAGPMDTNGVVAPVFAVGGLTDPLAKPSAKRSLGPVNVKISLTNNGGTIDPSVNPEDPSTYKDPIWGYAPDEAKEIPAYNGNNVYKINYYKSADGVAYTVYCAVTNLSHETIGQTSHIQWDFFKHFSRNPDGSITYTP